MVSESSSTDQAEERRQPVSDEEWKRRVKAEDMALDEKFRSEQEGRQDAESAAQGRQRGRHPKLSPENIPPASFETLVAMFSTQAMVALGMIPTPDGQQEVQLELARHFIDLLSVLEEKTAGNLEDREKSVLDSTLHQLRLAFVEVSKQSAASEKSTAEG